MSNIIYNFTNIPSHYRKVLWEKMISSDKIECHFFFGFNKYLGIKEIDFNSGPFTEYSSRLNRIKNFWFKKKVLIWQKGVVKECLRSNIDVAIFLGEFQIISTWISMFICKFRGIRVVYWSHGLYGNESFLKRKIRVYFYNTADQLLMYENRGKNLLVEEGLSKNKIKVIYNSLDYDLHLNLRKTLRKSKIFFEYFKNDNPVLLFVGRITKQKKIILLLEAQRELKRKGFEFNSVIIGSGKDEKNLKDYVLNNQLDNQCWFYGACYDEERLSNLIYNADLCVSPGNVGLTVIHSFSFGTPVCTHNNFFNQMPEVEAVIDGVNGCFFEENSANSLADKILEWSRKDNKRHQIRERCFEVVDNYYNPYYQMSILESLSL